jgi:hypothetical protein
LPEITHRCKNHFIKTVFRINQATNGVAPAPHQAGFSVELKRELTAPFYRSASKML